MVGWKSRVLLSGVLGCEHDGRSCCGDGELEGIIGRSSMAARTAMVTGMRFMVWDAQTTHRIRIIESLPVRICIVGQGVWKR